MSAPVCFSLAEFDFDNGEFPVFDANDDLLIFGSWEDAVEAAQDALADQDGPRRPFIGIYAHDGNPWFDPDGNAWAEVPDIDSWSAGWITAHDVREGDFENEALLWGER